SALPFILVLLGVIGGMIAFGFLGIFLGPTLLAVGYSLIGEWTRAHGDDDSPVEDSGNGNSDRNPAEQS
ncbi:MAG: AI-2E family transporter, partial [Gammaproteobacteria bacterium]